MAKVESKDSPTQFAVKSVPQNSSSTNNGEEGAGSKYKSNHQYTGLQVDRNQGSKG